MSILLETIRANNLGLLPFQMHLKLSRNLFPLVVIVCLLSFEQLVKKGSNWFQEIILERMHDDSFSNIIINMSSNLHRHA